MNIFNLNPIFSDYTCSVVTIKSNPKVVKSIEFTENFFSFIYRAFSELFLYIGSRGRQVPQKGFFQRDVISYDIKKFREEISKIKKELEQPSNLETIHVNKDKNTKLLEFFRKAIPANFHEVILGKNFSSEDPNNSKEKIETFHEAVLSESSKDDSPTIETTDGAVLPESPKDDSPTIETTDEAVLPEPPKDDSPTIEITDGAVLPESPKDDSPTIETTHEIDVGKRRSQNYIKPVPTEACIKETKNALLAIANSEVMQFSAEELYGVERKCHNPKNYDELIKALKPNPYLLEDGSDYHFSPFTHFKINAVDFEISKEQLEEFMSLDDSLFKDITHLIFYYKTTYNSVIKKYFCNALLTKALNLKVFIGNQHFSDFVLKMPKGCQFWANPNFKPLRDMGRWKKVFIHHDGENLLKLQFANISAMEDYWKMKDNSCHEEV